MRTLTIVPGIALFCLFFFQPDTAIAESISATGRLGINQFQTVGTHNSYRIKPHEKIMNLLHWLNQDLGHSLEYEHKLLRYQLEHQRVRQIELDVFYDPQGGHFAVRRGLFVVGLPSESGEPALDLPGTKVLHFPDFDYNSHCLTLKSCLTEIRDWSLENKNHFPLMILTEFKTETNADLQRFGFTKPFPMSREFLNTVDSEIRTVFSPEHLITPDKVRGQHPSLEQAILTDGWPSLSESRGKVFFAMDNGGRGKELYLEGHPSLRNRVMFVSSEPGNPEAAFIKMNNPTGANTDLIKSRVRQGYMIRTRADANTQENRTGDLTRQKAALESGAQYISTDYPDPAEGSQTHYQFRLPGGHTVRCNPLLPVTTTCHSW